MERILFGEKRGDGKEIKKKKKKKLGFGLWKKIISFLCLLDEKCRIVKIY
jgi:hypothetical protein